MSRRDRSSRLFLEPLETRANPALPIEGIMPSDMVPPPGDFTIESTTEWEGSTDQTKPELPAEGMDPAPGEDAPPYETESQKGEAGDPILYMTLSPEGDPDGTVGEPSPDSPTADFEITPTMVGGPENPGLDDWVGITEVPSDDEEVENPDPILTTTQPKKPLNISPGELDRLISGFMGSVEYARNQVQSQFLRYLNRLAENNGLDNWTAALRSGAIDSRQLAAILVSSPENIAASGYNAHTLFGDLYQAALEREADPVGLDSWTKSLFLAVGREMKWTPEDALRVHASDKAGVANQALMASPAFQQILREKALAFLQSTEYRKNAVRMIYGGLLGRDATETELQGWVNHMAAGHTERQLIGLFLRTPEYRTQYQTHRGLVTGLYDDLLFRAPDATGYLRWTGTFDAKGSWQSPGDPEFQQYYQQLLVYAQEEGTTVAELLQNDLDVAYATRIDAMSPHKFGYLASQNPHFTIGIAGAFLKNLLPEDFGSEVDFRNPGELIRYLAAHGEEIGQAVENRISEMFPGASPETLANIDLDLGRLGNDAQQFGAEMVQWVKGLYAQSLPDRIARHLPQPDGSMNWLRWFTPGADTGSTWPVPGDSETDPFYPGDGSGITEQPPFDTPIIADGSLPPDETDPTQDTGANPSNLV